MHKNIKLLAIFNFFSDFIPYSALGILYFSNIAGSFALGMSIYSITMLVAAVLDIPTGMFSDTFGRKKTIMAGACAAFLAVVSYGFASAYWLLVIGAILEGVSRSFFSGNNEAFLHDSLKQHGKEQDFHEVFGFTGTFFQLALGVSAIIGSFIGYFWTIKLVVLLTLIPKGIAILISSQFVDVPVFRRPDAKIYYHIQASLKEYAANKKLQMIGFATMTRYALGETIYTFRYTFIASLWPVWAIGFAAIIANIGSAISYFYSKYFIRRFGFLRILQFEIVINRIINLAAVVFPNVSSPALIGVTSIVWGPADVAKSALLQKEFTDHQRATMGSVTSFGSNILYALVAVLMGALGDRIGPSNTLIVVQIAFLSILWFYWRFEKLSKTAQINAAQTQIPA